MTYAKDTSVSVEKSKTEIEKLLSRYGASRFMSGWDGVKACIMFDMRSRRLRFILPLPEKEDYSKTDKGRRRNANSAQQALEQASRQRWRALVLIIKAKLEAVETGITTFDSEFLAHIVINNNQTVGDILMPTLNESIGIGGLPPLLPA